MKRLFCLILILNISLILAGQDWIPLNGPAGVNIVAFTIKNQTNELFTLTTTGEVFVSPDKGISWKDASAGIIFVPEFFWYTTKFAESQDGKLFLLYAKHFYQYDSSNNKWLVKNDSIKLTDFTVGPNGTIYAGDSTTFYISQDDGITFQKKANWTAPYLEFECKGKGNNFAKLDSRSPLMTFEDDGSQLSPIDLNGNICGTILYDSTSGNLLNITSQVYLSKNKGKTWQVNSSLGYYFNIHNYILRMPNGNILLFGSNPIISDDGGEHWRTDSTYQTVYNYNYLHIANDYTLLFTDNTGYLFIQTPNKNPSQIINPINRPQVHDIFSLDGNRILCNSDNYPDNFQLSVDNGASWNLVHFPINSWLLNEKTLDSEGNYYILESDSIYIFNVISEKFIIRTYPFDWKNYKGGFVSKTNKIFLIDGKSIFISDDKALNWINVPTNINSYKINFNYVNCSSNNILYYNDLDTIFYSLNNGIQWSSFLTKGDFVDFLQLSVNKIFYWLESGVSNYNIISSPDFGKTQTIETSIPGFWLWSIDDNDIHYFVSHNPDSLVIVRRPGNFNEIITASGLDYIPGESVRYFIAKDGYIYGARQNKRLYRTTKKISRVTEINKNKFIEISPNPFKEETHLKLPDEFQGQMKKWSVFDISGSKILEFYNNDQEIKIKGDQLQSGFYFVQVVSENNLRASGKMVVCK